MGKLVIDGREVAPRPQDNLLETCLALGLDLPYFCWHPALGSVGSCRQCAVKQYKDENDREGKIVMACMTPASEGLFSLEDPQAREFRSSVIEWLMTNHPHDCPICDEGGECHLQDMTVMTGHAYRRYRGPKRTFRNQDLGPCINHEMNRCITCYRCVRFYGEYAGGGDLQALASKNHVYFGRERDGTLENEFSGNLVEVCPTGVFTDKTLKRHYARKWDLQSAPSVCVHCAEGCNTFVGERYGETRRILNRYNAEINGHFLCDRGRFGYEFVNSPQRLRGEGEAALEQAAAWLRGPGEVIGIGSPRASLESNFALRRLVGAGNFVLGVSDAEARLLALATRLLRETPAPAPTLAEVEASDAVLVLGEDVAATAPRLALALRQSTRNRAFEVAGERGVHRWDDAGVRNAAQGESSPLFVAACGATRLDDVAAAVRRAAPDDLARLGHAVAHEIDPQAPRADGAAADVAGDIARALVAAERPLVVSGTGCGSAAVLEAAANVTRALRSRGKPARLRLVLPEANSLGLALLGGRPLSAALEAVQAGRAPIVLVLENDLYRRAPREQVDALLEGARVIAIDHLENRTTRGAALRLPAAPFAESSGTLVNSAGRAQRFLRACLPRGGAKDAWRWLGLLAEARDGGAPAGALDAVTRACAQAVPALARIVEAAPGAEARFGGRKIPRQPAPYSGRTVMLAQIDVHEPKPPDDPDSALAFSMEGYTGAPPPALAPRYRAPGWNSVQAETRAAAGASGVSLFNPQGTSDYFREVPPPFEERKGEVLLLPRYLVFGSEELSMHAPAIAARAAQHDRIELDESAPPGTAAVAVGLPDADFMDLPAWSRLAPAQEGS